LDFDGAHHAIARATDGIPHGTDSDTDQVHNEIFVLRALVKLVSRYVDCWRTIITGNFADAWPILQDALDQVRAIKKFSSLDVGSFEEQLLALESAYPYRLFASIGAVVERF